jgi:hypothetical protein
MVRWTSSFRPTQLPYRSDGRTFRCGTRRGMLLCVLKRRHLEVIRQLKLGLWIALKGLKVHQQRILDRKHGVVFYVLAVAVENLRNDGFVAGCSELPILSAKLQYQVAFGANLR